MKWIKKCKPEELSPEMKGYLREVWRRRGADHPGIFIQSESAWFTLLSLLAGLLLLLRAGWGLMPESLYRHIEVQCSLMAAGVACVAYASLTLRRRFVSGFLGDFGYFDGTWYWEAGPYRVKITELRQVLGFQLLEHSKNGIYTKSVAHITLPQNQTTSITFAARVPAQRFAAFFQNCVNIRRQAILGKLSPIVNQYVADPAGLAQAARCILESRGERLSLDRSKLIPIPDPTSLQTKGPGYQQLVWPATLGFLVLVAGWFGLPAVRYSIDHQHHYRLVKESGANDLQSPKAYLAKFPAGRYHDEVTAILDDRLFAIASSNANHQHSLAAIRDYLAGQPNERHRDEALEIIARSYDEAAERVRKLAADPRGDQNLLPGLLAILEYLKTQATPRVTVAFEPSCTVEPDNDLVRLMEQKSQSTIAQTDAVIEGMVRTRGSAIIDVHDTFSDTQVRRRQSIILTRLSAAVANILTSDLIVFRQTSPKQKGDIRINYEIKPRGQLTRYVQMPDEFTGRPPTTMLDEPRTTNTLGLLREYTIAWHLTIQPGSVGTAFDYRLTSNPGTNLVYRIRPSDPQWGVYAVLMYSAFYDFSNRMLTGVGLTPPAAPSTFTFYDAVNR